MGLLSSRRISRCLVAAFGLVVGLTSGCGSDPPPAPAGLCEVAKASTKSCKNPSSCDLLLAESCGKLDGVMSATALVAGKDCLESGVCGTTSCVSRSPKSAAITDAHRALAAAYCATCAPTIADCESQFYARGAKLPGRLTLAYAPSIVDAITSACAAGPGCQSTFAACATATASESVGAALDPDTASCLVQALKGDEGESKTGPDGNPQVAKCTKANCKGCCRDDKCEDGTTQLACGADAVGCETCVGAQKCTAGKCKEPCGPNNCAGCCDGDTCLLGTAKDKCGGEGAACTSCAGENVCSNKKCIDGSCKATCINGCCSATGCQPGTATNACGTGGEACNDCGFGRNCKSAACVIDPTALWDVYVSFAIVPDKDASGAAWDVFGGAPDPYLVASSSEGTSTHTGTTKTIDDSTSPFWAETPLVGVKASELLSNLSVQVWDADIDFDDLIGGCKIPLSAAGFDGSLQSYECPAAAPSVPVKVYFRIKPHAG